jgi:thiopurine S-methyltransferase
LASRGHSVIGVELSEQGCHAFFDENSLRYQKSSLQGSGGHFTLYESGKIRIFQGDFFDLEGSMLPQIGALYDRAALIALPPALRESYAAQILRLLASNATRENFTFLQIVLEKTDSDGPPFSVSEAELKRHYGAIFEMKLLSREKVDMETFYEAVYLLRFA